jgi:hypothetical protein
MTLLIAKDHKVIYDEEDIFAVLQHGAIEIWEFYCSNSKNGYAFLWAREIRRKNTRPR